jgi:hypothetical protein
VDRSFHAVTYDGGTWSKPVTIDPNGGGLRSISCPSASFCAAVDFKGNALTYGVGTWSSLDIVDPGTPLESVSCSSATSCIAVDSTSTFRWLSPTTTAVTAVAPHPVAGRLVAVRVQVRGLTARARSATPHGKVTVTDGRRNCRAVLRGL